MSDVCHDENNLIFSEAREDSMDRARLQRFEKPQSLDIDGFVLNSNWSILTSHISCHVKSTKIVLISQSHYHIINFHHQAGSSDQDHSHV